jgi:hypothetical protein
MAAVGIGPRSGHRLLAHQWIPTACTQIPYREFANWYGEIYREFKFMETATLGLEAGSAFEGR